MKILIKIIKAIILLLIIFGLIFATTFFAKKYMTNSNCRAAKRESQDLIDLRAGGSSIVSPSDLMLQWEGAFLRLNECCDSKGIKFGIVICPGSSGDLSNPVGQFSLYLAQQDEVNFYYPSAMLKQMNVITRNGTTWNAAGALCGVINVREGFDESVEALRKAEMDFDGNVRYKMTTALFTQNAAFADSTGLPAIMTYSQEEGTRKALILGDEARFNFSAIFAKDCASTLSASREFWDNLPVLEMLNSLTEGDVLVLASNEINIEECAVLAELVASAME